MRGFPSGLGWYGFSVGVRGRAAWPRDQLNRGAGEQERREREFRPERGEGEEGLAGEGAGGILAGVGEDGR